MTTPKVTRWVRGFDKQRGNLVAEYRLPESWTLERLRQLLSVADSSEDIQMYACYPIGERALGELIGNNTMDVNSFAVEYFLEADADQ